MLPQMITVRINRYIIKRKDLTVTASDVNISLRNLKKKIELLRK